MLVPSRTPWVRQPQIPELFLPSLAPRHCLLPSVGLRDLASGETWASFGTTPSRTPSVDALTLDSTAGFGGVFLTPAKNCATAEQTHLLVTSFDSISTIYSGLLAVSDSTGSNASLTLQDNGSGNTFSMWISGSTFFNTSIAANAAFSRRVIVVTGSAAGVETFVNGTSVGLGGTGPTAQSDGRIVLFGERTASSAYASKGKMALYAYWPRRLSAAEITLVSRDPWAIFAPTRRGIVVPVASGTTIAGGIGTATASGLQASIAIKTAIAGGIGTAAASGLQASIALRTNIAAGIGTATASGLQASIALRTAIAAGIGTATASGLQATITVGSGITINGGIGTATASGLQASISAQTTIQGGIGTAAASGLQATIGLRTPISGGIGTATASGLQAALTFPTSIAAGIGDATASGLPAGITFPAGGTIIFGVGSATASGLQALIREIGVSGGASTRGKKRGWANERAALEESLRQVDRIAEVMAESDEPQAQAIAEELEDYSGEIEQIELLRERLQDLQAAQRRKEMTAQKERDVHEAARELKAILDDDEEIAEVLDSMLHIEFRALRMIGVM